MSVLVALQGAATTAITVGTAQARQTSQVALLDRFRVIAATAQVRQSSAAVLKVRYAVTVATAQARQSSQVALVERFRITAATTQRAQSSALVLAERFRITAATTQRAQSSAAALAARFQITVATTQAAQITEAVLERDLTPPAPTEVLGGPWHRRLTSEMSPRVPRTPFRITVATRQARQRSAILLGAIDHDDWMLGLEVDGLLVGST